MPRRTPSPSASATAAPCRGCGTEPPAQTGHRLAAGVDASIKRVNLRHLRRIEGQIRGIASMIEEDRYCADIITQVAAARESLRTVARHLLSNHLRHCAAKAMTRTGTSREAMIDELLQLTERMNR